FGRNIAAGRGRPAGRPLTTELTPVADSAAGPRAPASTAARYLFVSDVHLDAAAPEGQRQFVEFIRASSANPAVHGTGARALYILGDLFESWIGDDDATEDRSAVLDALRELTSSGVACFLLHGNRDFLIVN
ncbi:MAG: hypothetical protein ACRET5_00960, partial [Steroidobacteraceae bacterium]